MLRKLIASNEENTKLHVFGMVAVNMVEMATGFHVLQNSHCNGCFFGNCLFKLGFLLDVQGFHVHLNLHFSTYFFGNYVFKLKLLLNA